MTQRTADAAPVGVLLGDRGNSFWDAMRREYESLAYQYGLRVAVRWASPEKDPAAQAAEFDHMLSEGFSALIVNPISADNLAAGVLKAARQGLPVFDVGGKIDEALVADAGRWYVRVLTVDFWEQGRMAGAHIARRLEELDRRGVVLAIHGRPSSRQSLGRIEGARSVLGPNLRVSRFEEAYGQFDKSVTARLTEQMIEQCAPVAIFCANDLMAVSAAEVCSMRSHDAVVVGVDGTDEGLAAVKSGLLDATVAFSPREVADVVLGAVRSVLDGGSGPSGFTVCSHIVTRAES